MKKKISLRKIKSYRNYTKLLYENKKIIKSLPSLENFKSKDAQKLASSYQGRLLGVYYFNTLVGTIGIGNINIKQKKCSIGIMILKKYQSLGIGFEALSKVINKIFKNGFCKIFLDVETKNHRAIGLYKKNNFVIKKKYKSSYIMELSNDK